VRMHDLRVLIVADDPLVRAGLAALLAEQSGCVVVGQVAEDSDLESALDVYRPDAVVWDLGWEGASAPSVGGPASGLERLAELAGESLALVVLLADENHAVQAYMAGARGMLPRDTGGERLAAALMAAAEGLVVLDLPIADPLFGARDQSTAPLVEELTPREMEVLQLLAEGLPNKAIAHRLDISEHTVKFHVNALMGKLAAQSRTEAVVRATRLGLILL
jgi:two-component system nitrate/nitrite response regulator NarL